MNYKDRLRAVAEEMAQIMYPEKFKWDNDRRNAEEKRIIKEHLELCISAMLPLATIAVKGMADAADKAYRAANGKMLSETTIVQYIKNHAISQGFIEEPQNEKE